MLNFKILLGAVLLLAVILRFYGLNWDHGFSLHPDERMIVMTAEKIHLPVTPFERENLFTPQSPLNPQFFAYGSFPLYLLKAAGYLASTIIDPSLARYGGLNLVGRVLSAVFDLGTLLTLYFLGKRLAGQKTGLLAAFFYALAVLPIQLSHFYAVDTPLTFFILVSLYTAVKFWDRPNRKSLWLLGLLLGLALGTKTSALPLVIPLLLAIFFTPHRRYFYLGTIFADILVLFFTAGAAFTLVEPFALIDFSSFLNQTIQQQQMTKSAFTFPYTLQYVGKAPYLYELKNIFLWGLGPILATLAFAGSLLFTFKTFRPRFNPLYFILTTFYLIYFAVVGHFAIGFMRYLLPLYPLLCLFAAFLLSSLSSTLKSKIPSFPYYLLLTTYYLLLTIWPFSFLSIYSQPNTRVQASDWINQNIPPGSTIAVEHWDDGLPLGTSSRYNIETLELYNPDTPPKWATINAQLARTEYLIIASNRLYVPLSKLTSCQTLPPGRCYPQTAAYYQALFSGQLGFQKATEFSSLPTLPFTHYQIDDFRADESFTVYDHPKVIIFKKAPV